MFLNNNYSKFSNKLRKITKDKLRNQEKNINEKKSYLSVCYFSYFIISKNDLKIRFSQIDLNPKRIVIDESKERLILIFNDSMAFLKFSQCLAENSPLFDFVKKIRCMEEDEIREFEYSLEIRRKRNEAMRALKKTNGSTKANNIRKDKDFFN